MKIPTSIAVLALAWLIAWPDTASAEVDDGGRNLAAARHVASGLLEPVGDDFGCEFRRLRLVRARDFDGYVAYADCIGERCVEALDVLNDRGESRSLRFVLGEADKVEEPEWEPRLGQFDLIHEINPDL